MRSAYDFAVDTRASRLASIPGAEVELRLSAGSGQGSAWGEAEAEGAAFPPGDGDFEVGEAGVDEDGVLAG